MEGRDRPLDEVSKLHPGQRRLDLGLVMGLYGNSNSRRHIVKDSTKLRNNKQICETNMQNLQPSANLQLMDWQDRLRRLLPEKRYSDVARVCGWHPGRVSQILGSGSMPNVVDAIIIARYVNRSVEEIWGEAADKSLRDNKAPLLHLKARSPEEAAQRALGEALGEVHEQRAAGRQASTKDQGKGHKSA